MKKVNGFSIAEAMIVLLIVSIAMAAMAPMISKRTLRGAGTCEWITIGNTTDIARPNSNVRVGGNATDEAGARLDVQSSTADLITQKISAPNNQSADIWQVLLNGVKKVWIDKDGNLQPSPGVPSGMIAFFAGACPVGWTNKDDWNNRFIMISSGGTGQTGDNNIAAHYHGLGINDGGSGSGKYYIIKRTWPLSGTTTATYSTVELDNVNTGTSNSRNTGAYSSTDATLSVSGGTLNPSYVQLKACQAP